MLLICNIVAWRLRNNANSVLSKPPPLGLFQRLTGICTTQYGLPLKVVVVQYPNSSPNLHKQRLDQFEWQECLELFRSIPATEVRNLFDETTGNM